MVERKSIILGIFADKQFKKSLLFHYELAGNIAFSEKLKNETSSVLDLILDYNFIGVPIPKSNYRSMLVFHYSIVYEVLESEIFIVLFWDTRRNPKTLKVLLQELS
ncbi:MAG: hypothetical protein HC854_09010 [Flavobacterium sp.]|nr:hypothetical protein [Flavobacterium sp.]